MADPFDQGREVALAGDRTARGRRRNARAMARELAARLPHAAHPRQRWTVSLKSRSGWPALRGDTVSQG